jgi:hypothetical protein
MVHMISLCDSVIIIILFNRLMGPIIAKTIMLGANHVANSKHCNFRIKPAPISQLTLDLQQLQILHRMVVVFRFILFLNSCHWAPPRDSRKTAVYDLFHQQLQFHFTLTIFYPLISFVQLHLTQYRPRTNTVTIFCQNTRLLILWSNFDTHFIIRCCTISLH